MNLWEISAEDAAGDGMSSHQFPSRVLLHDSRALTMLSCNITCFSGRVVAPLCERTSTCNFLSVCSACRLSLNGLHEANGGVTWGRSIATSAPKHPVTESTMLHWLKLKYIGWDWGILSETEILCLRLRYFVWDWDTLSETKIHCLRLNYYCLSNSISIYSLSPRTLFFPAINFFSPFHLLNSLAIHLATLALLPQLPKSLFLSTAHPSSASIYYIHLNLHPLRILIAALMLQQL